MSEVETQVETQQPVEEQQQLSEIKQLAREGKFKSADGGAVFCVECEKKSYSAETVMFEKLPRHKDCFKCFKCAKKIDSGVNAAMFDHQLYCRTCFQQSGFNRQQTQVKWTPKSSGSQATYNPAFANLGGGDKPCNVCNKKCYSAEAVLFEKNHYHPDCLRCQEDGCGVLCTVGNLNQFENKLLCKSCWAKGGYNKKQLAFTASEKPSGSYNPIAAKLGGGGVQCTTCSKTVYPAEMVNFEKLPYHAECLKCSECSLKMTLSQANKFEDKLYCTKCWQHGGFVQKQRDAAKTWTPKAAGEGTTYNPIAAKLGSAAGGQLKCKTCEKTVYPAEALLYESFHYHPMCFKCTHCSSRIENINQAQHNRKNPYHTRCFQELNLHRPENA